MLNLSFEIRSIRNLAQMVAVPLGCSLDFRLFYFVTICLLVSSGLQIESPPNEVRTIQSPRISWIGGDWGPVSGIGHLVLLVHSSFQETSLTSTWLWLVRLD